MRRRCPSMALTNPGDEDPWMPVQAEVDWRITVS